MSIKNKKNILQKIRNFIVKVLSEIQNFLGSNLLLKFRSPKIYHSFFHFNFIHKTNNHEIHTYKNFFKFYFFKMQRF